MFYPDCKEEDIKSFNKKIFFEYKHSSPMEFIFSQLSSSGNIPINLLGKFCLRAHSTHNLFNKNMNMEILALAIHLNGYHTAINDKEMIRFFHLYYKESLFYNNDSTLNDNSHPECHLLKFSHGRHLPATVRSKHMFILGKNKNI